MTGILLNLFEIISNTRVLVVVLHILNNLCQYFANLSACSNISLFVICNLGVNHSTPTRELMIYCMLLTCFLLRRKGTLLSTFQLFYIFPVNYY